MLRNLIQIRAGKRTVVMTDSLPKVRDRMKTLRKSHRRGMKGDRVEFVIENAEEDAEKFKQKPHTQWTNYDKPQQPKRGK